MSNDKLSRERVATASAYLSVLARERRGELKETMTPQATLVWALAFESAGKPEHGVLTPEDLLAGILRNPSSNAYHILQLQGVDISHLASELQQVMTQSAFRKRVAEQRALANNNLSQIYGAEWWKNPANVASGPLISNLTIKVMPFVNAMGYRKFTSDATLLMITEDKGGVANELLMKLGVTSDSVKRIVKTKQLDPTENF